MYIYLEPTYQKIHLISNTNPVGSFTKIKVFKNNVELGEFLVTPTSESFDKAAVFQPMVTSVGQEYIFYFEPADIGMTTYFEDGIIHVQLYNGNTAVGDILGVLVDRLLLCCIAKKLDAVLKDCDGCDTVTPLSDINTIHAYMTGARAAIRMQAVATAVCGYNVAASICENCGCS